MIDLEYLLKVMEKSATDAPQDPGAQAMAAAANIAKPEGAPPLPKMIDQGAEAAKQEAEQAKQQAEAQKQQEKQQEHIAEMEEETSKLRLELEEAKMLAMKNDAMRELAEERVEHNNAIAKEREAANADILKQRQQAIKDQEAAVQQLAQIKQDALDEKFEVNKQMAEESAQHQMELAQQKADSVVELANMEAKSYMKATENARKLQDKYMADAHKQMDAERAARPALSPALQNQVDNALTAVKGIHKLASVNLVLPVPGAAPAVVAVQDFELAYPEPVDMEKAASYSNPIQELDLDVPGQTSYSNPIQELDLDGPGQTSYSNPIQEFDLDVPGQMTSDQIAAANARQEFIEANGDVSRNPSETMMAAMSQLSEASALENQDPKANAARIRALRSSAANKQEIVKQQIAALKNSKTPLTAEQQGWLKQYDFLNERRTDFGGFGWANPLNLWQAALNGIGLGDSWLGRTLRKTNNALDGWTRRNLGIQVGSQRSALEKQRDASNLQGQNWFANSVGNMANGMVGFAGEGVNALYNMADRYRVNSAFGTESQMAQNLRRDLGLGDSYLGDLASVGLAAASIIPGLGQGMTLARGGLGLVRGGLGVASAATRLARGGKLISQSARNSHVAPLIAKNVERDFAKEMAAAAKAGTPLDDVAQAQLRKELTAKHTLAQNNSFRRQRPALAEDAGWKEAVPDWFGRHIGDSLGRYNSARKAIMTTGEQGQGIGGSVMRFTKGVDRRMRGHVHKLNDMDPLAGLLRRTTGMGQKASVRLSNGLVIAGEVANDFLNHNAESGMGARGQGVYTGINRDVNTYGNTYHDVNSTPLATGETNEQNLTEGINRVLPNARYGMEGMFPMQYTPRQYRGAVDDWNSSQYGLNAQQGFMKSGSSSPKTVYNQLPDGTITYDKLPNMVEGDDPYRMTTFANLMLKADPFVRNLTHGIVKLTPDIIMPQDDPRKSISGRAVAQAADYAPSIFDGDPMPPGASSLYNAVANAYAKSTSRPAAWMGV